MIRLFLFFLLSASIAFATPNQDAVKQHFTEVIESQIRLVFEAQVVQNPNHPQIEQKREEMETFIQISLPEVFKTFGSELGISVRDADAFIATLPDKEKNIKAITKNIEQMNRSPLPKPVLVSTMVETYENNPDQDEWFLETLKRLSAGTARQLKEQGAQQ